MFRPAAVFHLPIPVYSSTQLMVLSFTGGTGLDSLYQVRLLSALRSGTFAQTCFIKHQAQIVIKVIPPVYIHS